LRIKRQRVDLQICCIGGKYNGYARAKTVTLQQFWNNVSINGVRFSAYYVLRGLTNSALRIVAQFTRPWVGGSGSSKPGTNPFANWIGFIWIAVGVQFPSGSGGHIHGSKNCLWLDHIRFCIWCGIAPYDADKVNVSLCITECDINILPRKFWEDEEIPQKLPLKEEDEQCERHFVSTHSHMAEGRYTVQLPFKTTFPPIDINDSLPIATALLARMESKL